MERKFLERLQSNRSSFKSLEEFRNNEISRYREFEPSDSFKNDIDCIFFETKGKGKRERLQMIHHCKGDTGRIGDVYGEIYLKGEGLNFPRRFKVKSHRLLIKK